MSFDRHYLKYLLNLGSSGFGFVILAIHVYAMLYFIPAKQITIKFMAMNCERYGNNLLGLRLMGLRICHNISPVISGGPCSYSFMDRHGNASSHRCQGEDELHGRRYLWEAIIERTDCFHGDVVAWVIQWARRDDRLQPIRLFYKAVHIFTLGAARVERIIWMTLH